MNVAKLGVRSSNCNSDTATAERRHHRIIQMVLLVWLVFVVSPAMFKKNKNKK